MGATDELQQLMGEGDPPSEAEFLPPEGEQEGDPPPGEASQQGEKKGSQTPSGPLRDGSQSRYDEAGDDYDPTEDDGPTPELTATRAPADPFGNGEAQDPDDVFRQGGSAPSHEPTPGEGEPLLSRFEKLLGRTATAEEREELWRYRSQMNLADDDPVWDDYWVSIQHQAAMQQHRGIMARFIQRMTEKGDAQIRQMKEVFDDLKADWQRSQRKTLSRLPDMVEQGVTKALDNGLADRMATTVDRIAHRKATANTLKAFVAAVLAVLLAGGVGYWLGQRHMESQLAGAEKWLNSEQGQFARRLTELNPTLLMGYQNCRWRADGTIYEGETRRANGKVLCYPKDENGTVVPLAIERN